MITVQYMYVQYIQIMYMYMYMYRIVQYIQIISPYSNFKQADMDYKSF